MGLREGSSPVENVDLLVPFIAFAVEVFAFALRKGEVENLREK